MSDARNLPDPNTLTRQPGAMGSSGIDDGGAGDDGQVSVEQALAEVKAAKEASDRRAADERAAAQEATRERDAARAQLATANAGAINAREQAVDTAIAAQNAVVTQAKEAIALAQANGDPQAVADAMERMAEAKAELRFLGGHKQQLAGEKQRQTDQGQRQPQDGSYRQQQGHEVRTPGGTLTVGDAAKQWMDAHQRFYTDPAYYNHAVGAHSTITADGIQEGTPAYFRALDERMQQFERYEAFERGELKPADDGGRGQMNGNDPYAQQRVPQRGQSRPSASSVGAPPSRGSAPSYSGNNNGAVDPMAIARQIGPGVTVDDLREFARSNGYSRGKSDSSRIGADGRAATFESDEAGFQAYLREQRTIMDLQARGEDVGLRYDTVYR